MDNPPINIDYWASLYSAYTDYAQEYDKAMDEACLVDRAEHLWEWKGLNRNTTFEQSEISEVLKQLNQEEYINQEHEEAIESLSDRLNEEGIINSRSLVTCAFLLHLMASGPDRYCVKFPIYDRRVWNAYVYLWRVRGEGEQLYRQASQSPSQYGTFCRTFRQTCPDSPRDYERALFMFGGFIMDIQSEDGSTLIEDIDEKLVSQERALTDMHDTSGYASVNIREILDSD